MITPSGEAALDDFDFFQSPNRMAIECAFGILITHWGVLWRPLDQRFDRRSLLLEALMRLHNFCISKNIEDDTKDVNGLSEIQPDRWTKIPLFDKESRPVQHLDTPSLMMITLRLAPNALETKGDVSTRSSTPFTVDGH